MLQLPLQIGQFPEDLARNLISGGDRKMPLTPTSDIIGPYKGSGNENDWAINMQVSCNTLWIQIFEVIKREYDRACHLSLLQVKRSTVGQEQRTSG